MIHNINNQDAVVNIESADTVNIIKARVVNLGGFVGVGEPWIPGHSHVDECKQWITSRAIPENAPCICHEVPASMAKDLADLFGRVLRDFQAQRAAVSS